jgi:hypothetical protein
MDELLRPGGPHQIRRTGDGEYQFSIAIPPGRDGFMGQKCPSTDCSPGYFRVKFATDITGASCQKAFWSLLSNGRRLERLCH